MASKNYLDDTGLAYFLTKLASWIPSWFPSLAGQSGKFLSNDGTSLYWTSAGGGSVTDVQIDGSSILSSGIANVPIMTASTLGVAMVGSNLSISNGVLSATDTTYSAGTGLSLSGTTLNHSNSVSAGTAGQSSSSSGSSLSVPYINFDSQGHATGWGTHTHTVSGFLTESGKSQAQRGYYKFSDGLIVQWGAETSTPGNSKTFPTAFSSASSYGFAFIPLASNVSGMYLYSHTASNFQVKAGQLGNFMWVAIGY